MNTFRTQARGGESGQVFVVAILALSIFLIGALAFAIDLSHMWFNRQSAQTAADAACTAGVMDLLSANTDGVTSGGLPAPTGTAVQSGGYYKSTHDCNSGNDSGSALCQYAALNGFNSSIAPGSTALGNNVSFDFPASGSATAPPGVSAPTAGSAPVPFLRVIVNDNIPTFFAGMLQGKRSQSVKAYAVCGLQSLTSPIPIEVLHPTMASSLKIQGGGGTSNINIIGGPKQSIQVNSCSSTFSSAAGCSTNNAAGLGGSANINLCQAGPGFCGANMGVYGKESQPSNSAFTTSCGTNALCTGAQQTPKWASPEPPISDPFQLVSAPSNYTAGTSPYLPTDLCGKSGTNYVRPDGSLCTAALVNSGNSSGNACSSSDVAGGTCFVDYQIHGCPLQGDNVGTIPQGKNYADGCALYTPGYYSAGIHVKNQVAVFDPGLYWIDSVSANCTSGGKQPYALCLDSNSFVRPSLVTPNYVDATGAAVSNSWPQYANTVGVLTGPNPSGPVDGGTIFYFHGVGSVVVDSNSGKPSAGNNNPDTFGNNAWQLAAAKASQLATCPNNGHIPNPALPDSIGGNILLAPCSLDGTWGNPGTAPYPFTATFATDRGMLFFQDRGDTNNASSGSPVVASWGGGGQFLLAGTMYFHQCHRGGGVDSGTGCATATGANQAFNVQFSLGGNSGSNTYVLGEIIADQLTLTGSGTISMHLSPSAAFTILKASLLQ